MDLGGKHVVITGGSGGIGAALGHSFAGAGARVTLVARGEEALRPVAEEVGATAVAADVREPEELMRRVEQVAPVDVLVNNAGLAEPGAFGDLTTTSLRTIYAVNATAPAELALLALPGMLQRRLGRIVFVSSLAAHAAVAGLAAYSATKASVGRLAEGLHRELRGTGVGVTLAELGTVDAGMYRDLGSYPPTVRAFDRLLATRTLRLLTAEEVATAVTTACREDRHLVVLPRRARAQAALVHLPQRLANLVT
ncbi:SDR family NAD(P)-dependent oxidoreductase [Pseudonocardia acaciae]|uniref:SDR family NAD(P)-dependent oxidoreductase n=1 Tax=Pseudonocardia acaciae TaxID=551276 RepID=UPI0006876647|nr:SDR family NAD(P)-dependent oxidoreductase [Pseudonocardia acaciae]